MHGPMSKYNRLKIERRKKDDKCQENRQKQTNRRVVNLVLEVFTFSVTNAHNKGSVSTCAALAVRVVA